MRAAFNIVFRIVSTLLGLLMILMGLVWIGQGLHVGPAAIMRGFMVSVATPSAKVSIRWSVMGRAPVVDRHLDRKPMAAPGRPDGARCWCAEYNTSWPGSARPPMNSVLSEDRRGSCS